MVGWMILAACSPSSTADRWLASLARGDDAEAFAQLDVLQPPPGGFDVARFGKRVDRLGLRAATEVDWTDPRRESLEGTFPGADGPVPLSLRVGGGRIRDVQVGDARLVPVQTYFVVPDERPVGELVVPDLWARPGRFGLAVGGTSDVAGTLTVNARCLTDGRWVANAMMGQVQGPFTLHVDVPPGSPCQLGLRLDDTQRRRDATLCQTDAIRPGPCVPGPEPAGPPVVVSEVTAAWSPGGLSVDYWLRANVPQPAPHSFESAVVTTTVTCPGGKRPVIHTRPVNADWLEPGVDRVLGSPMAVHATGRPCALALDYARDDGYDRLEIPLFEGCLDADGLVSPGGCGPGSPGDEP